MHDEEFGVFISSIKIPDAWDSVAGIPVEFTIGFENKGSFTLDDFQATVVSQELGLRASVGNEGLGLGETRVHRLLLDLPRDVFPGNYPVRITLSSDKFKRVIYRDVQIIR